MIMKVDLMEKVYRVRTVYVEVPDHYNQEGYNFSCCELALEAMERPENQYAEGTYKDKEVGEWYFDGDGSNYDFSFVAPTESIKPDYRLVSEDEYEDGWLKPV